MIFSRKFKCLKLTKCILFYSYGALKLCSIVSLTFVTFLITFQLLPQIISAIKTVFRNTWSGVFCSYYSNYNQQFD